MKPLELLTSSFRFRDESQFQPWCEDNRVHRVAPLLHFATFEVIGAVDWKRVFFNLYREQCGGVCAYCGGRGLQISGA